MKLRNFNFEEDLDFLYEPPKGPKIRKMKKKPIQKRSERANKINTEEY